MKQRVLISVMHAGFTELSYGHGSGGGVKRHGCERSVFQTKEL